MTVCDQCCSRQDKDERKDEKKRVDICHSSSEEIQSETTGYNPEFLTEREHCHVLS